jgi:hypothetical protein
MSISLNITTGMTYRFRYRAMNINGWSGWSPIGFIKAASVPQAPLAPTLVGATSTSITVKINLSLDNGGAPILDYKLFIDQGSLGSLFTLVSCYDG